MLKYDNWCESDFPNAIDCSISIWYTVILRLTVTLLTVMLSGWFFTSSIRDAHVHMSACLSFSYNTHTSLILKFGDSPFSWMRNFHIKFYMYSSECKIWSVKTCFPYLMPPSKTKSSKRARKVLSVKEQIELINEYSKRKVPFKILLRYWFNAWP